MSKYIDEAKVLRSIVTPHYNCGQSVVLPFASDAHVSKDLALRMTANFNLGLKRGAACGAITGGVVVLGLFGVNDPETVEAYYKKLSDNHSGLLECAPLLKLNEENGFERKPHCDALVYEVITLVEEILREKNLIR